MPGPCLAHGGHFFDVPMMIVDKLEVGKQGTKVMPARK